MHKNKLSLRTKLSPNSSFFQQLLEEQKNLARKLKEVKEQLEIPAKFGYRFSGFSVEQLIFPEKNVLRTAFSQNSSRWLPLTNSVPYCNEQPS